MKVKESKSRNYETSLIFTYCFLNSFTESTQMSNASDASNQPQIGQQPVSAPPTASQPSNQAPMAT